MKSLFRAHAVGALVFLGFTSTSHLAHAGPVSACDEIAQDVRAAVSKDPSKVLMIVEDALVINETCACEIIKAAITAANADTEMVQQIVQTGLAVAPKMSAIIAECAASVAPGSGEAIAALTGEKEKEAEGTDFGDAWATNLRGVYLIQPAAAGVVTQFESEEESDENNSNSRRTRNVIPLSPSCAGQ
jgi:hypothetical protein